MTFISAIPIINAAAMPVLAAALPTPHEVFQTFMGIVSDVAELEIANIEQLTLSSRAISTRSGTFTATQPFRQVSLAEFYTNFGIDSLIGLEILSDVEQHYAIRIPRGERLSFGDRPTGECIDRIMRALREGQA